MSVSMFKDKTLRLPNPPARDINIDTMVFVFGSNNRGMHGAGAARFAHQKRGAQYGKAEGFSGQSYAIPTMDFSTGVRTRSTLPLTSIQKHVDTFLEVAHRSPGIEYQVTCIGCGLAGLRHRDIAPMFRKATSNCYFDTLWSPWLGSDHNYWGTF